MSAPDDSRAQPRARAAFASQRGQAVVVALVVIALLGTGWLADTLVMLPQTPTQGAMSRQIGFSTVSLTVSPSPLRANQVATLRMRVTDASGQAVVGARVACALSMPTMAMALPTVAAVQASQPGQYMCSAPPLEAGLWALDVTLTLPTGETGHATFRLSAT